MIVNNASGFDSGFSFGFGNVKFTALGASAIPRMVYGDLAQKELQVAKGGTYNALGSFPTGSEVTIVVYDPVTFSLVGTSSAICNEIESTGIYVWGDNSLTIPLTTYQEYVWVMTDGITTESGLLQINSVVDISKLLTVSKFLALN